MTEPLFVSANQTYSGSWANAFPEARILVGLPKDFTAFQFGILVLDLTGVNKSEFVEWLDRATATNKPVVALSPTPNDEEGLALIQLGAKGYGHSHCAPHRLQEMVTVVEHGGLWVGNHLLKRILAGLQRVEPEAPLSAGIKAEVIKGLSGREAMVAKEVALGATNSEISSKLNITERTVKAHISSIFEKLGVRNRVEVALKLNQIPMAAETESKAS